MRPASSRVSLLLVLPLLTALAGCNYIHFGRLDRITGDAALAAENADLRTEQKLLKEELAIAHKEGDALRAELDRPPAGGPASEQLVAKLNETTHELATLRANYARLQSERERLQSSPAPDSASPNLAALEQIADLKAKLGDTEEKLASTLHTFTELQEDNGRLRTAIDQAHAENAALTNKVQQISAQNDEARSALVQLSTELLAQKEARARAEQTAESLRTQLHVVTDHRPTDAPTTLAAARESSALGVNEIDPGLHLANDSAASPPTATLSTNHEKLLAAQTPTPPAAPPVTAEPVAAANTTSGPVEKTASVPAPAPSATRTYVVRAGDTLEQIAEKFYGHRERWRLLYAANNALLSGGRPLRAGMELEIPAGD